MIIDKNIPIPNGAPRGAPPKYPFRDMEVGDSVLFPEAQQKIVAAAHVHGKFTGKKFKTRSTEDGGVRIWRIA